MASNTFSLKIISANRVFFTGRCQSVIVPGYDGQKEVLAHHENMVIAVNEGEMRFLPEGEEEWQYAVVGIGFIEIVNIHTSPHLHPYRFFVIPYRLRD